MQLKFFFHKGSVPAKTRCEQEQAGLCPWKKPSKEEDRQGQRKGEGRQWEMKLGRILVTLCDLESYAKLLRFLMVNGEPQKDFTWRTGTMQTVVQELRPEVMKFLIPSHCFASPDSPATNSGLLPPQRPAFTAESIIKINLLSTLTLKCDSVACRDRDRELPPQTSSHLAFLWNLAEKLI